MSPTRLQIRYGLRMGNLCRHEPSSIVMVPRTPARTESRILLVAASVMAVFAAGFIAAGFIGLGIEAAIILAVLLGTATMAEREALCEDGRLPRAEASFRMRPRQLPASRD